MSNQTKIDDLDKYLEKLFRRKKEAILPKESFVTYLGNRLKFEFSQQYPQNKKKHESLKLLPEMIFSFPRLALVPILTLVIVLAATFYFLKSKNSSQLASLEGSISSLESELTYLDRETQEIASFTEESIDRELTNIEQL